MTDRRFPVKGKQLGGLLALILAVVCAVCGINLRQDPAETAAPTAAQSTQTQATAAPEEGLRFANRQALLQHYEKHGIEMGFSSPEEYLAAANAVISDPNALHKLEADDNDHVYFLEATNEIVFVSQAGVIRTYFHTEDGKAYFDRQ